MLTNLFQWHGLLHHSRRRVDEDCRIPTLQWSKIWQHLSITQLALRIASNNCSINFLVLYKKENFLIPGLKSVLFFEQALSSWPHVFPLAQIFLRVCFIVPSSQSDHSVHLYEIFEVKLVGSIKSTKSH